MPPENFYVKAIHHPDRQTQLRAFRRFCEDEIERVWHQLDEIEADDGTIPDDKTGLWSQRKGELDTLRLFHGMFVQSLLSHGGIDGVTHSDVFDDTEATDDP